MAHFGATMALAALTALGQEPGLLGDSVDWREIPFVIVEAKPLVEARVNGTAGWMMFDTGTPLTVLVNRDAVALEGGDGSRTGHVASGQSVDIRNHAPVPIEVGGVQIASGPVLISGDFGFTEVAFGEDFLGFVGTPAVEEGAFLLDYSRKVLTVLRTDADGALAVNRRRRERWSPGSASCGMRANSRRPEPSSARWLSSSTSTPGTAARSICARKRGPA